MPQQTLKKVETVNAPAAIGPYSQAIVVEQSQSLVFVSGQLPIDPKTGELVQGDMKALTNQVLDNIDAILQTSGSNFSNVIRMEIFLTDLKKNFVDVNAEYAKRFSSANAPARQTVEVSRLPKDSPIEISCIAVVTNKKSEVK